jgi:probable phosphoglycerate mutase
VLLLATLLFLQAPPALDALAALPPPLPGSLRLYLVRHGQALSNLDPAPDLPPEELDQLTERGRQQSERAGKSLAGRGVSLVLTSPASRARETAERIATAVGAPAPSVEPRLRPLALGQGKNGKALDWDERIAEWKAGRDPIPPGGESLEQVGARVAELVAALWKEGKGRSVVLVAHGEVIGSYVGELRGTPAPKRYPPDLANASITVIDVGTDGRAQLRLVNYRPPEP